jgi:triacylglycerol lipase
LDKEEDIMNIVLAHGILGFKKLLGIDYFNGINKRLKDKFKANVLVTEVDPTKSVEYRGKQLRNQILDALRITESNLTLNANQKVHIIAHSMGGLDSRFILSPQNPDHIAEQVTSLTTIGTPHQGSPVADLCYALLDGKAPLPTMGALEHQVKETLENLAYRLTACAI